MGAENFVLPPLSHGLANVSPIPKRELFHDSKVLPQPQDQSKFGTPILRQLTPPFSRSSTIDRQSSMSVSPNKHYVISRNILAGCFPQSLVDADVQLYRQQIQTNLPKCIHMMNQSDQWRFIQKKNGANLYASKNRSKILTYKAVVETNGSLNDLLNILSPSSDELYLRLEKKLASGMLDHQTLQDVDYEAQEDAMSSISLNWSCYKPPGQRCIQKRDFVFLEAKMVICHANGDRSFILFRDSVKDSKKFPSLPPKTHITRALQRSLLYITESKEKGGLIITLINNVNLGGNVPYIFRNMYGLQSVMVAANLVPVLNKERSKQVRVLTNHEFKSPRKHASCITCRHKLGMIRKAHNCRICGEVVCASCSYKEPMDLAVVGLVRVRMCTGCRDNVKSQCHEGKVNASSNRFNVLPFQTLSSQTSSSSSYNSPTAAATIPSPTESSYYFHSIMDVPVV